MTISKLAILSALLAGVTASPLLPPAARGNLNDEKVLPGQTEPAVTGLPVPAGAAPLPHAHPTRLEPGHATHKLLVPRPSQTAPAALVPRLDIMPASTAMPEPNIGFVPAPGCTSTLSEGRLAVPCPWDYTTTIYPFTTTLYKSVDCDGCDQLRVIKEWYFCPNQRIEGTKTVATPSTIWSTVCESSIVLKRDQAVATAAAAAEEPVVTNPADLKRNPGRTPQADLACPTTYVVQPEKSAGKTMTKYSKFTTTTIYLDCKGCPLTLSTALVGYGPPNGFTKTTTLPVGVTTTYACY
ncbi:hypothetical protein QBC37DRAFT_43810 [Rhypophila decipiens]|uniref:Uncharacterized protein n=1 Tax=Rhypophila decipiens TaxID=261697 RepID=A0AAN7B4S6_9PEZI|nr:hypothetical protein QBC37DRAFT_43810 [Rhypophila decipiens]